MVNKIIFIYAIFLHIIFSIFIRKKGASYLEDASFGIIYTWFFTLLLSFSQTPDIWF